MNIAPFINSKILKYLFYKLIKNGIYINISNTSRYILLLDIIFSDTSLNERDLTITH